jgi:hypothetical protein
VKTLNLTWSAALAATILFAGVAAAKNEKNDNLKNAGNGRLKVLNQGGQSRDQRRFEPFHSNYVVLPGDSLPVISLKEYGTSKNARFIAQFNHISESQALQLNEVLNLPSIGGRGKLSQSHAPVADTLQQGLAASNATGFPNAAGIPTFPTTALPGFPTASGNAFQGQFAGTANPATFAAPTATTLPAPLSRVMAGSTLLVDAVQFGSKAGSAQLRIGGAPMKVEVLEWTASAIKVRLPQLQLAAASQADLLIIRADGRIASKTSLELIAAPSVALAK